MRDRKKEGFDPSVLLGYLRKFDMNAVYTPPNFLDGAVQLATIELSTTRILHEALIREINSRLNWDNGFEASLRVIDYGTLKGGRMIHYAAEVVPKESLRTSEQKTDATYRFLHSLPKAIKNVTQKYRR
ncbi:hypothetical protein J4233_00270 [Candidatus Pacearchaeota archaeon]|nr:hypothetical protein [Candidatus Pacearchaeota archaeon]